jgi:hypothetical protein
MKTDIDQELVAIINELDMKKPDSDPAQVKYELPTMSQV